MWAEEESIRPDLAVWDYYSHGRSFPSSAMDSMSPASLASLSSLLTPSESNAFHSFLSAVPGSDHWGTQDGHSDRAALAKATKDLMALDTHFAAHSDHLFSHLAPSSSRSQPISHSDDSSRTPTPTSPGPPFLTSGRHSTRSRPSRPQPYPQSSVKRRSSQSQPLTTSSPPKLPPLQLQKPALLSASQKKANHIQSEQKRRANIRRGYEALCECVPALQEALREEEESLAAPSADGRGTSSSSRRKAKSPLKLKEGDEKLDGRAGPRSENVVLSKTIDYINELIEERNALFKRLNRARSSLPSGHPALIPLHYLNGQNHERNNECPLWEREWKGGHGTLGNMCDADGEESS